jgi:uncharacterized membrane protein
MEKAMSIPNPMSPQATAVASKPNTLGITALVLSIVGFTGAPTAIIGLVLGYLVRGEYKAVGLENIPALAAIIIGWVCLGLWTLGILAFILILGFGASV